MYDDPLIPPSSLVPLHAELLRRINTMNPSLSVDVMEGEAGEALARSLLFEHWPDMLEGYALDAKRIFYNRYYWFVRFVSLRQATHGYDAGLAQQAFQQIEGLSFDVEWDLLQELDTRAREAPGCHNVSTDPTS